MSTALTIPTTRALATTEEVEPSALRALKPREQRFALAYVENGGNATKAYGEAGYKTKAYDKGGSSASVLLRSPKVARAIREVLETNGYTAEAVQSKLLAFASNDPRRFEAWMNGEKTLDELAAEGVDTTTIQEVLIIVKPSKDGPQITRKLRFSDSQQAVTTIGKILGLLDERKHLTVSGMVGVVALDLRDKSGEELATIQQALTTGQPPPKLIDAVVVDSDTSK